MLVPSSTPAWRFTAPVVVSRASVSVVLPANPWPQKTMLRMSWTLPCAMLEIPCAREYSSARYGKRVFQAQRSLVKCPPNDATTHRQSGQPGPVVGRGDAAGGNHRQVDCGNHFG